MFFLYKKVLQVADKTVIIKEYQITGGKRMNLTEIKQMNNEKLMSAFYWIAVKATNEANSRGGYTKKTAKQEEWIIKEVCDRFNLDYSVIDKEINP
jgi:hypothetical protein